MFHKTLMVSLAATVGFFAMVDIVRPAIAVDYDGLNASQQIPTKTLSVGDRSELASSDETFRGSAVELDGVSRDRWGAPTRKACDNPPDSDAIPGGCQPWLQI